MFITCISNVPFTSETIFIAIPLLALVSPILVGMHYLE